MSTELFICSLVVFGAVGIIIALMTSHGSDDVPRKRVDIGSD